MKLSDDIKVGTLIRTEEGVACNTAGAELS